MSGVAGLPLDDERFEKDDAFSLVLDCHSGTPLRDFFQGQPTWGNAAPR